MDFTHATELAVTSAGVPLAHLFFELILNYSGHRYVQIAYSENFESLSDGLQAGLWAFGGVPERSATIASRRLRTS